MVAVCTVFFLSYFVAMLGGVLVVRPQMVWPLWPGCALLVAVLLQTERRVIWPALLMAGLAGFALYDFGVGLPIRTTLLFLLADTVEILVATLGVTWAFGGKPRLNSIKALAKYSIFALVLAPASVASLGASATRGGYRLGWEVSFLTEALALLTLTPAILSWIDIARSRPNKPWTRYAEAALMLVGLGIVAFRVCDLRWRQSSGSSVCAGTVPPMVCTAFRHRGNQQLDARCVLLRHLGRDSHRRNLPGSFPTEWRSRSAGFSALCNSVIHGVGSRC